MIKDGQAMPDAKPPMVFSAGITSTAGVAYLIILFSAGLLTNFVPLGTTNTGTILLYLLACVLSFTGMLYLFDPPRKHIARAVWITLALSGLILLKAAVDTNDASQRAQEIVIFFLGAWPLLFFIQMDVPKVRKRLLDTLGFGLFALSAFAIVQGVLGESLPLSLFVLRGDNTFSVDDNQIFRPTGLTGNPIIFSSILVFASAYFAALWLEKRKKRFLVALVSALVANYLTYTRVSIVLVVPVLVLVWLLHKRFHIEHKIAALTVVILAAAGGQYLMANGGSLIIIQRLQNSDPSSLRSTLEHFEQIQDARDAIALHPLAGTGMGSQGDFVGPDSVIITDGAWWILVLEFGIPLAILAVILLGIVLVPLTRFVLRQDSQDRALAIATMSFHAYIIPANFINSALLGHISFALYWVALGLSLAGMSRRPAGSAR